MLTTEQLATLRAAIRSDMTIDSATIAEDQTVRVTSWTKTAPH